MDACPLPTYLTDTTGKVLYVNRAYEVLTGYSIADVTGDKWQDTQLVTPASDLTMRTGWAKMLALKEGEQDQCLCMVLDYYINRTTRTVAKRCISKRIAGNGIVGYIMPADFHCEGCTALHFFAGQPNPPAV